MTRDEAIAVFNSLAIEMTAILAGIPKNESEAKQIQRYIDAYDMAISALRQQEKAFDCTQYEECEYNGNPVCRLPAKEKCPHGLKRNEDRNDPLTLEELQKMDGEPVWVQFLNHAVGYWDISKCHNSDFFNFCRSGFLLIDEYGKTWLAYRQKPEEGTV